MSDIKKDHPRLQDPNHVHHPYWKHAHRDWRVWVGATLMLAIMLLYVWRGALGWPPLVQTQQPHVVPAVK
jgi:hypothetical protein